jgi:hypothetical protein
MENEDYSQHEESEIEELRSRVDDLESRSEEAGDSGGIFVYMLGSCLAMILSWSRNASILWCIGHGFASWIYVVYLPSRANPS